MENASPPLLGKRDGKTHPQPRANASATKAVAQPHSSGAERIHQVQEIQPDFVRATNHATGQIGSNQGK